MSNLKYMPIIFSRSCEYALQAVLFISNKGIGKPKPLQDIAAALHIPQHYLSKILQTLARHEIVVSYKGHKGGFDLGKGAAEIHLSDIVRAIDGDTFLKHCVIGFPTCGDDQPCPVHSYWKEAKHIIQTMLSQKTIDDLSKNFDTKLSFLGLSIVPESKKHNNISQNQSA